MCKKYEGIEWKDRCIKRSKRIENTPFDGVLDAQSCPLGSPNINFGCLKDICLTMSKLNFGKL